MADKKVSYMKIVLHTSKGTRLVITGPCSDEQFHLICRASEHDEHELKQR